MKTFLFKIFAITAISISCAKEADIEANYHYGIMPGKELLIYGGNDNKEFLGKLNASRYDSESIWNQYGKHGNCYNSKSIWNSYGTYGSEYSSYSPFNDYASHPPILVDKQGNFYGYFTSNKYKPKRANMTLIDIICDNHEKISKDVSGWYEKIFR